MLQVWNWRSGQGQEVITQRFMWTKEMGLHFVDRPWNATWEGRLQLAGIEEVQEQGFDDVVAVVTERDLRGAKLSRNAIEVSSS